MHIVSIWIQLLLQMAVVVVLKSTSYSLCFNSLF